MPLTNGDIAELLMREAEKADTDRRRRALQRAAHAAIWRWTEEAAELRSRGAPFTELRLVGPWIAHFLDAWFADGIEPPERPAIRAGFLTLTEARATIAAHPEWGAADRGDLQVPHTWSDCKGKPLLQQ